MRCLLKLRPKALPFLRISIGNGDETYFWWDPWTPFGSLIHYLGLEGPSSLGIPLFSLVKDSLSTAGWRLPPARSDLQLHLYSFISTIQYSPTNDKPSWVIQGKTCNFFSSNAVWKAIRPFSPQVSWDPIVWHKVTIPKHAITTWLFVLNRNPTLDRLLAWGLDVEPLCLLCGSCPESRNHLFFECPYSTALWKEITLKLGFQDPPYSWECIIQWLPLASPTKDQSLALLLGWQASLYEIWSERNRRFHNGTSLTHNSVLRIIKVNIKNKCIALKNQKTKHGEALFLIWS
ncbi:hypothetical protein V5N11_002455 [Cardamine amara subsp. amara]|uniref:Reverse transcriptase zinc-binding domain-containing protein n=1 Tax=Cardamine amara subsp. amara TaxID=228776 RepID=A0ABD1BZH6_CARAN